MKINFKFTQWEVIEIAEELNEAFLLWLKENPNPSSSEVYDWIDTNDGQVFREDLCDTYEPIIIEENQNNPTVEVFDENGNMIWDNLNQFNIEG